MAFSGKRKTKQNIDFSSLRSTDSEDDSNFESSSVSDWESSYKYKKKKKVDKRKRRKRSYSPTGSEGSAGGGDDHEESSGDGVITIKHETVEVKHEINSSGDIVIQSSVSLQEEPPPKSISPGLQGCVIIKKERDDVIYISSDEENGVSSNVNKRPSLNRIKNGLAMPQPITNPPAQTANRANSQSARTPPYVQTNTSHKILMPQPIPERRIPQPMIEPIMPKPIAEPIMPKPIVEPMSPRQGPWSPRMSSPRSRIITSPRVRSPGSPMMPSPIRGAIRSPTTPTRSPMMRGPAPMISPGRPRNPAVRNLFPQTNSSVPTVEGILEIGQKPDGSYGYHVRLPDGGIINVTRHEIEEIRVKNNGVLPVKLEVPLVRNKKF